MYFITIIFIFGKLMMSDIYIYIYIYIIYECQMNKY